VSELIIWASFIDGLGEVVQPEKCGFHLARQYQDVEKGRSVAEYEKGNGPVVKQASLSVSHDFDDLLVVIYGSIRGWNQEHSLDPTYLDYENWVALEKDMRRKGTDPNIAQVLQRTMDRVSQLGQGVLLNKRYSANSCW
jgi:hypothetical protein